jgi:transposase-like protein
MSRSSKEPIELFKRCHFDGTLILLCIRWYISYKVSYRDLVAMMAERNVDVAHTTIMRWVQRYVPKFVKRWQPYARAVGSPGGSTKHT